jgi:hypothetical protein
MKKFTLILIGVGLFTVGKAQQGCSSYSLQKGDSLVYTRLMPPPYDPAFGKLKPKDKIEYLKKQNEDIKNGTLKLREAGMTIKIGEKENTESGFTAKAQLTLSNPGSTYVLPYVYECYKDTLFTHPEQQYSEVEGVGITYTGTVAYPMKMKKGDILPDNKNITIGYKRTGSNKFMMPYITKTTTTHHLDSDGTELYKTIENTYANKEVTNNFSNITTMETTYANREVVGDTTFNYKGKTYKGFIIRCYLLNSTSVEVTADYYQKSIQRITNRAMAKAARKLADDESGLFTTIIEDVFVPELGVVSTLISKKDGSFFSKSMLVN